MESPDDLTTAQWSRALDQSWAPNGGTDLLHRMRDSIAAIDTTSDRPKLTKEEFLADLARTRG